MAAYVAEKEIHVSSVTAASTRSSTVAAGGWNEVKLPPLPQKTREALEAAAMQPLYVKDYLRDEREVDVEGGFMFIFVW